MNLVKKQLQHSGSLYAICLWEETSQIFVGGADKIVSTWSLDTCENDPFSIRTQSAVLNLKVLSQNQLFVGLFNGHFHLIDLNTKQELHYITKHKRGIYSSAVSEDGTMLILGTGEGIVSIWRLKDMALLLEKKISDSKIRAIQVIGNILWIGTNEGVLLEVALSDLKLQQQYRIDDHGINSLCYLPEKNTLLIGDKDAHLSAFSISAGKLVLRFPAHNWPIYQIVGNHPEGIITVSRDKTIKVWNGHDLSLKQRLSYPEHKGHTHSVNNAVYDVKSKMLITISDDKSICFWK